MALGKPSHLELEPSGREPAASPAHVRDVLSAIAGVVVVRVPPGEDRILIGYDTGKTSPDLLRQRVATLGWRERRTARSACFAPAPRGSCC